MAKLTKTAHKNQSDQADQNRATWHSQNIDTVLESLSTSRTGLTQEQATQRRAQYGTNAYPTHKSPGFVKRLAAQINNLLIYVLLGAALITWLIDHRLDSIVILAVVVLNVSIGLYQEGKAEKSLQAIRKMLAPNAQVWRDGQQQTLAATELVPGDVVSVSSGDNLPADLRWFSSINLRVDESALTGESVAVSKSDEPVEKTAAIGDRFSMGFAGTIVTQGQGRAVVVATGLQTEMGRIGRLLEEVQANETPLVRSMTQFSRWLTVTILVFALLLFGYSTWLMQWPLAEAFMAVVGLAVAAIPEGLPAILTITMAIGVQRMASRHAVIRRLPAVETLGAVTTICSDKTGTLTRNEMTAEGLTLADATLTIQGSGYSPEGAVYQDERTVQTQLDPTSHQLQATLATDWLALTCALCNDSALAQDGQGNWHISGDPTEGALLTLATKLGLDIAKTQHHLKRIAAVPFESEHRYMATAHSYPDGEQAHRDYLLVKGAPEKLLTLCENAMTADGKTIALDLDYWHNAIDEHADQGRRVLGIAVKPEVNSLNQDNIDEHTQALTFIGLIGIMDPPREEAIEAVSRCQQAGIQVKMITGDHTATALAIASKLGIGDHKRVLAGHEIEALSLLVHYKRKGKWLP